MRNNLAAVVTVGLSAAVLATPVFSSLGVNEYQSKEPYGNAQTPGFRRALAGGTPLTAEEERRMAGLVPISEAEHYYGRVSVNTGTLVLDKLKNKSASNFKNAVLAQKRSRTNQTGLEFALGYIWSGGMRGEVEYLVNRNMVYNTALSGAGTTTAFRATVKNHTLLINGYYDFLDYDRFRPFLTAGVGVAVNSVNTQLTPTLASGEQKAARNVNLAYQVGVGFRLSLFTRWAVNASYRYVHLGNAVINPNANLKWIAPVSLSPFSLGLTYLF